MSSHRVPCGPAPVTPADPGVVVPLHVCAGCRPSPLVYAMISLGDHLDEMELCPSRDVCTWFAGHDLGGDSAYDELPEGSMLPVAFANGPYFSCKDFDDHQKFLAAVRQTKRRLARASAKPAGVRKAET